MIASWQESYDELSLYQFSSVQLFSHVRLFATPWTAAHQASLSIANSWSLLKLMSTESMIPSNHLTLCCPRLLLPSVFCRIRVFQSFAGSGSFPRIQFFSSLAKILEFQLPVNSQYDQGYSPSSGYIWL